MSEARVPLRVVVDDLEGCLLLVPEETELRGDLRQILTPQRAGPILRRGAGGGGQPCIRYLNSCTFLWIRILPAGKWDVNPTRDGGFVQSANAG